jgi:hydrogenase nickel incorporation protein HypA/HybF
MHEFSLATEIVDIALSAASESGADTITAVHLAMNPASHLDQSALAGAFEIAAAGTQAAAATLEFAVESSGIGEIAVTAIDVSP